MGPCGKVIDRYRIEHWLGGGGFGAVYRAEHTMTGRKVAFKLLRPEMMDQFGIAERLFREARMASAIGSPHIASVLDAGLTPTGVPFLVMELVEGVDLRSELEQVGRFTEARAVAIVLQILSALNAAHAQDIVHRDVKPSNVMLLQTPPPTAPDGLWVKLLDFGIGKLSSAQENPLTQTDIGMGTPGYAAPEQFLSARDVDRRADLYSVAVVLYRLLAGRLPSTLESDSETRSGLGPAIPVPLRVAAPGVSSHVAWAVDRCLSEDPAGRYATAEEFAMALAGEGANMGFASGDQPTRSPVNREVPSDEPLTPALAEGLGEGSVVRGRTAGVQRRWWSPRWVLGLLGLGALLWTWRFLDVRFGRPVIIPPLAPQDSEWADRPRVLNSGASSRGGLAVSPQERSSPPASSVLHAERPPPGSEGPLATEHPAGGSPAAENLPPVRRRPAAKNAEGAF